MMSDRFIRNTPYIGMFMLSVVTYMFGEKEMSLMFAVLSVSTVLVDISEHLRDLKTTYSAPAYDEKDEAS